MARLESENIGSKAAEGKPDATGSKTDPAVTGSNTFTRVAAPTTASQTDADVAIIAWHGMGQQIRFETVETIVRALVRNRSDSGDRISNHSREHSTRGSSRREAASEVGEAPRQGKVDVRFVELGKEKMWRAELDVMTSHDRKRRVHIYEVYWAPLTEGKITLKETIAFLFRAGLDGLRFCFRDDFRRHLFGQWRTYPVNWTAAAQLLVLLAALAALIIMNFAVATATSVSVLTGGASTWPSYSLLGDLTIDLAFFEAFSGAMLAVLGTLYLREREHRRTADTPTAPALGSALVWTVVGFALASIIAAGVLVSMHLIQHRTPGAPMWWRGPAWLVAWTGGIEPSLGPLAMVAGIWIVAVAVSYILQAYLVQYVGDVAIYVTSHSLDRYYETRQATKDISLRTAQAIYEFGKYGHLVLIGHSLGSVIAYDTLNRLVNEDALKGYAIGVTSKTGVLITLGSPLDKTAFLFRAQSEFSDVREAMAAAAQPLITDYAHRPVWLNISSPNDPISGPLNFYDPPSDQAGDITQAEAKPVRNIPDPQAWIPLLAHSQYWTNDLFVATLRKSIDEDRGTV